jgi:hypothetical protein
MRQTTSLARTLFAFTAVLLGTSIGMSLASDNGFASSSTANDRTLWVGRSIDGNKSWTCSNTTGDHWVLKENGKVLLEYDTVEVKDDYIELQATAIEEFDRVRLYKDKLQMNEKDSKFKFMDMAKGKWSK